MLPYNHVRKYSENSLYRFRIYLYFTYTGQDGRSHCVFLLCNKFRLYRYFAYTGQDGRSRIDRYKRFSLYGYSLIPEEIGGPEKSGINEADSTQIPRFSRQQS